MTVAMIANTFAIVYTADQKPPVTNPGPVYANLRPQSSAPGMLYDFISSSESSVQNGTFHDESFYIEDQDTWLRDKYYQGVSSTEEYLESNIDTGYTKDINRGMVNQEYHTRPSDARLNFHVVINTDYLLLDTDRVDTYFPVDNNGVAANGVNLKDSPGGARLMFIVHIKAQPPK